jgi:hypothetical protein
MYMVEASPQLAAGVDAYNRCAAHSRGGMGAEVWAELPPSVFPFDELRWVDDAAVLDALTSARPDAPLWWRAATLETRDCLRLACTLLHARHCGAGAPRRPSPPQRPV